MGVVRLCILELHEPNEIDFKMIHYKSSFPETYKKKNCSLNQDKAGKNSAHIFKANFFLQRPILSSTTAKRNNLTINIPEYLNLKSLCYNIWYATQDIILARDKKNYSPCSIIVDWVRNY